MPALQTVATDFDCIHFSNSHFTFKELSVWGFRYNETVLPKSPYPVQPIFIQAGESCTWIANKIHVLNWDSVIYDYSSLYCFFLSLKIRFPNVILYANGNGKCLFLRNSFSEVIDSNPLSCHDASAFFSRDHCSREKVTCFLIWLSQCQQRTLFACLQLPKHRRTSTVTSSAFRRV